MDTSLIDIYKKAMNGDKVSKHDLLKPLIQGQGIKKDSRLARKFLLELLDDLDKCPADMEYGWLYIGEGIFSEETDNDLKRANEYYKLAKDYILGIYSPTFAQELIAEYEIEKRIAETETEDLQTAPL